MMNCYSRDEGIDQLFLDEFRFFESNSSGDGGESTYAYLGSHEVDSNTIAAKKRAAASDPVDCLSPTQSSEAFDGSEDQHNFFKCK